MFGTLGGVDDNSQQPGTSGGEPIFRSIIRDLKTNAERWELPDVIVDGMQQEFDLHTPRLSR